MFDKDITIINRCFDKKTRTAYYKVSHVKGYWSSEDGISINGTHLIKSDGLSARILMNEEGYQKPEDFNNEINKLTLADVDSMKLGELNSLPIIMFAEQNLGWTLQTSDYLVKGKVENFEHVSNLLEQHQDVMKITKIAIKDYGSEDMWHFAITGA